MPDTRLSRIRELEAAADVAPMPEKFIDSNYIDWLEREIDLKGRSSLDGHPSD